MAKHGHGINWTQLVATTAVSALVSVVVSQAYLRMSEKKARERERDLERNLDESRLERLLAASNPAAFNQAANPPEPQDASVVRGILSSLLDKA